jgi:hypothetical protein
MTCRSIVYAILNVLHFSILLQCCSMGFAGYVSVCVQLYCVNCHCLTLHVSAYRAMFVCSKQTNTHTRNNKINEEKQNRKNTNGNHVKKNQRSRFL